MHTALKMTSIGFILSIATSCVSTPDARARADSLKQPLGRREIFDLKLRCADLGRRFDRDVNGPSGSQIAVRFAFNEKLNTCLYKGGSISKEGVSFYIVDLATNEEHASYLSLAADANTKHEQKAAFDMKERELFGPTP